MSRLKINQAGFIKFTKRSLISLFIFWTVVVGTGLIYLFNPFIKTTEAVWALPRWGNALEGLWPGGITGG